MQSIVNSIAIIKEIQLPVKTYFIFNKKANAVKIGITTRIEKRLKDIQAYCPDRLELVHIINDNIEKELHEKFRHLHIHGEWFMCLNDIRDYLRNNNCPHFIIRDYI